MHINLLYITASNCLLDNAKQSMTEVDLPFDINSIIDAVIPVYTALVCVIIVMYHTFKPSKKKDETYALKRANKKASTKDWKEQMCGKFNQYEFQGLDDWLIFCGKPYPVRLLAPKMFLKIVHDITVKDGKFKCIKTYLEGNDKVTTDDLIIASSEAERVDQPCKNDDELDCLASAWTEDDKILWYEIKPPTEKGITLRMSREMVDEDTIEVVRLSFEYYCVAVTLLCCRIGLDLLPLVRSVQ
jgi:hypothetical protein